MTLFDESYALATFAAFCRIGACIGLAPGFSSPRIPMRVRLLMSLGLTIAFAPLIFADENALPRISTAIDLALSIVSQLMVGVLLGLSSRFIVNALESLAVAIAMSIGVTSTFATRVDESELLPELSAFIIFAVTALIFLTDQHWTIVRALVASFSVFPMNAEFDGGLAVSHLLKTLSFAFPLALQIAAPFLVFGILVNIAFALVNKFTPQIAMYFVSVPFAMAAGFALLYLTWKDLASVFINGLTYWLARL